MTRTSFEKRFREAMKSKFNRYNVADSRIELIQAHISGCVS